MNFAIACRNARFVDIEPLSNMVEVAAKCFGFLHLGRPADALTVGDKTPFFGNINKSREISHGRARPRIHKLSDF